MAQLYNPLKPLKVAESGGELTRDIVRATLFGPTFQIPTPQISPPTYSYMICHSSLVMHYVEAKQCAAKTIEMIKHSKYNIHTQYTVINVVHPTNLGYVHQT